MGIRFRRFVALLLLMALAPCALPAARAKTVAQWLEGYETGETWFGEDFAYDITDEQACWELSVSYTHLTLPTTSRV